jgi:excisionase family DNA binding protein
MKATPDRRVFYVPEVAERLGRTELATRRAIERGEIPARRWGRRVVVLAEDLDMFLRALPARKPTSSGSPAA